jgi:hypothetical protein
MQHRMGTRYSELGAIARPVELAAGSSRYFTPLNEAGHDPKLFDPGTDHVRADIRSGVLKLLYDFWRARYRDPEAWSTVWIAGSALSHQWSADHAGLVDLDVLIGVDLTGFLQAHPDWRGFSEKAIAEHMNAEFRAGLTPHTSDWRGFEATFYVNPGTGNDIRSINPYAAYNLTTDEWTVRPPDLGEDWGPDAVDPSWWAAVDAETARAQELVERYNSVAALVSVAPEGPRRVNLQRELGVIVDQVAAQYGVIHGERSRAFQGLGGIGGGGYLDYYNFRWQIFKKRGLQQTLNEIRKLGQSAQVSFAEQRYGAPIAENVLTPSTLLDL